MGPTVGGFLTDSFSWHWLFLVNIVPGLSVAAVVWLTIDIDKPDFSLLRGFDLIGLLLMAVFLGCFQYALEEGPRWEKDTPFMRCWWRRWRLSSRTSRRHGTYRRAALGLFAHIVVNGRYHPS
jgi:DHA2 family multidrug resistance protein